jgi:superfamily II DNA or RNA helicase
VDLIPKESIKVSQVRGTALYRTATITNSPEFIETLWKIDIYERDETMRELQKEAFKALAESLRRWETKGAIKLPTWTGKTRIFTLLLWAFRKNWLILVPRVDLYESTKKDLVMAGFRSDWDIHFLHEQQGWNAEDRMMELLTSPTIDWGSGRNQCIMTYQALTALVRRNAEMGVFMRNHFDIVIEDEAHRGLGNKTKTATEELTATEEDEEREIQEAEEIVQWIRYNYKFTATPDLIQKSVTENAAYIFYATIENAVKTWAIIFPQFINIWEAYTRDRDLDQWRDADIAILSEWDDFIDISGKSIRDTLIETYSQKRRALGKLPCVAFASTIKHAMQIVEEFEKKWIAAARVTSGVGDISSWEAIARMDAWTLDVIVTVTKVSEWFDYPPLSCAIWFCPSLSSAKILQWNGRIMRVTQDKRPENILNAAWGILPSPSSFIIAPSAWHGRSSNGSAWEKDDWEEESSYATSDQVTWKSRASMRIGNFYEHLVSIGEVDINSIPEELRKYVDLRFSIQCQPGEECCIDDVVYMGVTNTNEVLGVKWPTILRHLKRAEGGGSISARQKNGSNITLVPRKFILGLLKTYEPGEEYCIDDVVYMGVTNTNEILGVKWPTILRYLKRAEGGGGISARQKNGSNITLIPREFILGLTREYVCQPGEECRIDDVVYMGVTEHNEVLGVKWQTILKHLKRAEGGGGISARQKNGRNITLVPRKFILGLLKTYEPGEEYCIDDVVYMGVTNTNEILGVKWPTILRYLKRAEGGGGISARQKNGRNITLVPRKFILGLLKTYEPGEECRIDDVVYMGVTNTNEVLGVKWEKILKHLKRAEGGGGISARQKNGSNITLVPREFILGLK